MQHVALFLAGAGSTLDAVLYVVAVRRRESQWPAQPGDWSERDFGDQPEVSVFHTKGDTL